MQVQYDPALYIGCIIEEKAFKKLHQISLWYAEIASKKAAINSMMRTAEEVKMITQECISSGFYDEKTHSIADTEKQLKQIQVAIEELKNEYLKISITNLKKISKIQTNVVTKTIESPCDWTKTQIKTDFPIAADTIKVDSAYITFDENTQKADTHISSVKAFVQAQFSDIDDSGSMSASKNTQKHMSETHEHHRVKSTLVITAIATHKNATQFAPCVFDVEKLVNCWNASFPSEWLNGRNPEEMKKLYHNAEKSKKGSKKVHAICVGSNIWFRTCGTCNFHG